MICGCQQENCCGQRNTQTRSKNDLWISSLRIVQYIRPILMVCTDKIHRWSVDLVCATCTFSVLIVDACPQIICGSCLCRFSFLIVPRDEIHRSSVDLVCVFLCPNCNFLVDIHRSSVDLDKKNRWCPSLSCAQTRSTDDLWISSVTWHIYSPSLS